MTDLARLYDFVNGTVIDAEQVDAEFNQLIARINDIDADSLVTALAQVLGVSQAGTARRGKSIIATSQSRSNTAYGLLTTPDRVSGIVLPTDGLIVVGYHATWQESVAGAARAAIFVGANQQTALCADDSFPAPVNAFINGASANIDRFLTTCAIGLLGQTGGSGVYGGDVATGVALGAFHRTATPDTVGIEVGGIRNSLPNNAGLGGPCFIWADAGTYDISVQFKASSGSVTAKNRKLWVWTLGF